MSGRDVIGIAKTGSGKTLAFLLPMFRHIMDQPELDEMDGPIGIFCSFFTIRVSKVVFVENSTSSLGFPKCFFLLCAFEVDVF